METRRVLTLQQRHASRGEQQGPAFEHERARASRLVRGPLTLPSACTSLSGSASLVLISSCSFSKSFIEARSCFLILSGLSFSGGFNILAFFLSVFITFSISLM